MVWAAAFALVVGVAAGGCSPNPDQPLAAQLEALELRAPAILIATDTGTEPDPLPFWGQVTCETHERVSRPMSGGDTHTTATGQRQADEAFRRLRVFDGDDVYGERCELGLNDQASPVAFYTEGQRLLTFASFRLPRGFPLETPDWQGVLQMKQTQPSDNGGGTPALSLGVYDGRWRLFNSDSPGGSADDHEIWSIPAERGTWTRFAFDVTYSSDPAEGSVKVYADLNEDGDANDQGERSPKIRTYTLKREIAGGAADGLKRGQSIPSHLRAGIYHNQAIDCPPPRGCSIDLDNIQVIRPGILDALVWR